MELDVLMPSLAGVVVRSVTHQVQAITVELECTLSTACCPVCSHPSNRVHSGYVRTIRDLPWADKAITLKIGVRRFRCEQECCPRKIFAERLHPSIAAYARRTTRLEQHFQRLALSMGGEGTSRLAPQLGLGSISGDTLLRIERKTPLPPISEVKAIGIDEWAIKKGQTYGTILVDLHKRCPLDLLPDASAETIAEWLRKHPEIKVVTRDRDSSISEGARRGAPQAIQVADRFHLLQNLTGALKRMVETDSGALLAVAQEMASSQQPAPANPAAETAPAPTLAQQRHQRVKELLAQGLSMRQVARQVGLDRKTVKRYQQQETLLRPRYSIGFGRNRSSFSNAHLVYLQQRAREVSGRQVWLELQAQGYRGSISSVYRAIGVLAGKPNQPTSISLRPLSARQASFLLSKKPEQLTEYQHRVLLVLLEKHLLAAKAYPLVQQFVQILSAKQAHTLATWLAEVKGSPIPSLRHFAIGLERDFEAVYNACSMDWSNGQVEGQVNRLKLIKRQMYGRAKLDLLKKRVLFSKPIQIV